MSHQIFTGGQVKRRKDGTFAKKGADEIIIQTDDLNYARKCIAGTNRYIKYTGDELKSFCPQVIPKDTRRSRGASLINLDQQFFGHVRK